MCDWEAEEYAEYLLWVEAEKARTLGRTRSEVLASEPLVRAAVLPQSTEA